MQKPETNYGFVEWLSAEEMHEASVHWMSELKFARDEQLFLNDLVRSHTVHLVDTAIFNESKKTIDALLKAEQEVVHLMKRVQSHENLLQIMVNDVDEPKMEKAYVETHWELVSEVRNFMLAYRQTKTRLFGLITKVMKKNKRLLT